MSIYFIGGSPCSGKSTVAESLSERFGLQYFKVDDHLERYMQMGAHDVRECCARAAGMSPEQIWMRPPEVQCDEELRIYSEIFGYILDDLKQIGGAKGIITEGAAFLPKLMQQMGVPAERYLSITPTKEFQVFHYSRREWVPYILAECSDKEQAFDNWMERDALFAQDVRRQCVELGYASVVNDGSMAVQEMIERAAAHFGLK